MRGFRKHLWLDDEIDIEKKGPTIIVLYEETYLVNIKCCKIIRINIKNLINKYITYV